MLVPFYFVKLLTHYLHTFSLAEQLTHLDYLPKLVSLSVMVISGSWLMSSLTGAAEDREQLVQSGRHPPEIADVAPMDGIRVVTKVVVGELLQPSQLARMAAVRAR